MRHLLALSAILSGLAGPVALAKDLAHREPQPRSTGCEWAGPGFVKAEGSETCIKVGGAVRVEYGASAGHGGSFHAAPGQ